MKLSIICPCYNEEATCKKVVEDLLALKLDKEIIVVDDGSFDKSNEILSKIEGIKLITKANGGKGSAIKFGIKEATGDVIVPFDLDGEYDVNDLEVCLKPILEGAEVVYGSRRLCKTNKPYSGISYFIGGIGLNIITNILYGSHVTDEPTCLKMGKADLYKSLNITSDGFEWEPEMTAKIIKRKIDIKEVPIHYYPRTKKQGKKIKWKDGFIAVWTLLKYKVIK